MRLSWFVAPLLLTTLPALAQDDRTLLSGFLEDQLSDGSARQVVIEGFEGALSSEARLARLTISDDIGPWLVLEDATLIWTRSALLGGALKVDELTAERLTLVRMPDQDEGLELADAEATPFALPDLPVSIEINELSVSELVLEQPVLGQRAVLSVEGNADLSDGSGAAQITLVRRDGQQGIFDLDASFSGLDRFLSLDLELEESAGGIAAELLSLPDRPDLDFSIKGEGPLDDFSAELALATAGEDRLLGQITSTRPEQETETRILVDIGGDIRPLLAPAYREFFGDDARLQSRLRQIDGGGTRLETLELQSAELSLTGHAEIDAQGLPIEIDLEGALTPEAGEAVVLPIAQLPGQIASASFGLQYDRATDGAFRLETRFSELQSDQLEIRSGDITVTGALTITETRAEAATLELVSALDGIWHVDEAVDLALGDRFALSGLISWVNGAPLLLTDLIAQSGEVGARGTTTAKLNEDGLLLDIDLAANVPDLERFAPISDRPLAGSFEGAVSGRIEPLSGAFDLSFDGQSRDLRMDASLPADLFGGVTELGIDARRDESGLSVDRLTLDNDAVALDGSGSLSAQEAGGIVTLELQDVGDLIRPLSGPAQLRAVVQRQETAPFEFAITLTGPSALDADINGRLNAETGEYEARLNGSALNLRLGDGALVQLTTGLTTVEASLTGDGQQVTISDVRLGNGNVSAQASGSFDGQSSSVRGSGVLRDVALFTDALNGPVSGDVTLTQSGADPWRVVGAFDGPGGLRASVAGNVNPVARTLNVEANGQAPLAFANRFIEPRSVTGMLNFDLGVQGPFSGATLSGDLRSSNARLAFPDQALALENIAATASLVNGLVRFSSAGNISSGGRLTAEGTVDLGTPGLDGRVDLQISNGRLVNPSLYEVSIPAAEIAVTGPLGRGPRISGLVNVGEAQIRVPEASLAGDAAIPDIEFTGASGAEQETRAHAGLSEVGRSGGRSARVPSPMNLFVNAPARLFLRGRGIDAEFGGSIRLEGTTSNIVPIGQFDLRRGRLSILGTRLDFTQGSATLQGNFDPFLRLSATSQASGYTIRIDVIGPASRPEITFSSDPALPEDEVLAQLLFGRSLSALSPVQILQLADAATSLAGGSSNRGLLSGLRDNLALDDLDLTTDEEGNAAVTAGRYLSENVYTDVTINAEGDADLSLNIDLSPNLTARGSVGSDGGTSLGVFFERDY